MNRINRRQLVLGGLALSGYLPVLRALGPLPVHIDPGTPEQNEANSGQSLLTRSPDPDMEERVDALLARMTLKEKVRQLCSTMIGVTGDTDVNASNFTTEALKAAIDRDGIGSISRSIKDLDAMTGTEATNLIQQIVAEHTRLGIPPFIDGEGIRGLRANGSCIFTTPLGMAATWDPDLIHEAAMVTGNEAQSRGIHRLFAPVLDLCLDPRNGRTEETYGEDPFLTSRLGVAFVKGLQSKNVIATPKHFLANFVSNGGRDSGDVELSERALRELHFVAYKAAIIEGGALGLMCAYNSLNGVPCGLNSWLLTDVLRNEWHFQGAVVSDWGVISNSVRNLHAASTPAEAARRALTAGTDIESPRLDVYDCYLSDEVQSGRCSEKTLDEAVRRVLRLKFRLGLFEKSILDPAKAVALADCSAHRQTALEIARRSIVLLQNTKSILPLSFSIKSIAVIGPNADSPNHGSYTPNNFYTITPLQAIRARLSNGVDIHYAKGCELTGDDTSGFAEAIDAAKNSEAILVFVGGSSHTATESKDRADLDLSGKQEELIHALATLGKPIVIVLITGGPVTMTHWIAKVDALLMAWYPGEMGCTALVEILTGACNPSGHLPITIPRFTGQLPMPYNYRPYGRAGSTFEISDALNENRYEPLFPFGHGLSYTNFTYTNIDVMPAEISRDGTVQVSVSVNNSGSRQGEDVVQLYLSVDSCRITQPVQRLIAFKRIALEAGASQIHHFILDKNDLAFLNEDLKPEVNLGPYTLFIGNSCRTGTSVKFNVVEVGHGDPYS